MNHRYTVQLSKAYSEKQMHLYWKVSTFQVLFSIWWSCQIFRFNNPLTEIDSKWSISIIVTWEKIYWERIFFTWLWHKCIYLQKFTLYIYDDNKWNYRSWVFVDWKANRTGILLQKIGRTMVMFVGCKIKIFEIQIVLVTVVNSAIIGTCYPVLERSIT